MKNLLRLIAALVMLPLTAAFLVVALVASIVTKQRKSDSTFAASSMRAASWMIWPRTVADKAAFVESNSLLGLPAIAQGAISIVVSAALIFAVTNSKATQPASSESVSTTTEFVAAATTATTELITTSTTLATTTSAAAVAQTSATQSPVTHKAVVTTTHSTTAATEGTVPSGGPTALCNDGTYSYAEHHQGACSHHGGVSVFYK